MALLFDPTYFCTNCGNKVEPRTSSKINWWHFLFLLFLGVLPGMLYLAWGGTQVVYSCPKCKAENTIVPLCPWCEEPILTTTKFCEHCGRDIAPVA
jgi:DNA-directed RNA polymerase subunit RPC12/RpoP